MENGNKQQKTNSRGPSENEDRKRMKRISKKLLSHRGHASGTKSSQKTNTGRKTLTFVRKTNVERRYVEDLIWKGRNLNRARGKFPLLHFTPTTPTTPEPTHDVDFFPHLDLRNVPTKHHALIDISALSSRLLKGSFYSCGSADPSVM